MLDEKLLNEALRWSGERTYSAAVSRALDEFVRYRRARQILSELAGAGAWEGDLSEMRRDRSKRPPRRIRGSR